MIAMRWGRGPSLSQSKRPRRLQAPCAGVPTVRILSASLSCLAATSANPEATPSITVGNISCPKKARLAEAVFRKK